MKILKLSDETENYKLFKQILYKSIKKVLYLMILSL
jgi:hypothetical protein